MTSHVSDANQTGPADAVANGAPTSPENGFAEIDARLAGYPDPLAYLTPERFRANREMQIGDTLGVELPPA